MHRLDQISERRKIVVNVLIALDLKTIVGQFKRHKRFDMFFVRNRKIF